MPVFSIVAGGLWIFILTMAIRVLHPNVSLYQTMTLLFPLLCAMWIVYSVTESLALKAGLPYPYKWASWLYLGNS